MHPNFHFTTVQILWTLTFAAQLVLLVVLLGRDRARRFKWFTLSIILMAVRLLASRLLFGRLPSLTLSEIFIVLADFAAIVGFLVVVEIAQRAFAGVKRGAWWAFVLAVLVIAGGIVALWGPWPAWKTVSGSSALAVLRLMQLAAQKIDLLVDVLTIEVGLLVVLLGRGYSGGWRTHAQRIVIGLSTASISQLAVQGAWQHIARTAAPHSQAEYEQILGLRDKLFNANGALYVLILVWWIACLWMDEKGTRNLPPHDNTPEPEYLTAEGVAILPGEPEGSLGQISVEEEDGAVG